MKNSVNFSDVNIKKIIVVYGNDVLRVKRLFFCSAFIKSTYKEYIIFHKASKSDFVHQFFTLKSSLLIVPKGTLCYNELVHCVFLCKKLY